MGHKDDIAIKAPLTTMSDGIAKTANGIVSLTLTFSINGIRTHLVTVVELAAHDRRLSHGTTIALKSVLGCRNFRCLYWPLASKNSRPVLSPADAWRLWRQPRHAL